MKLVTKKCPNCGANLSFEENDKKIKCEYCKQQIMIERENNSSNPFNSDEFILEAAKFQKIHSKMATGVIIFIIICFVFIFVFAISMIVDSVSTQKIIDDYNSNKSEIMPTEKPKNNLEISQIAGKTLEELKSSGLEVLDTFATGLNEDKSKKWNYVGLYLLKKKDFERNTIYLVYKKTYTVENKSKEYYSAVSFSGLRIDSNGNITYNGSGFPYAPTKFVGMDTVHGYESNKELYDKVIKSDAKNQDISATDGMYIELQ